jgi:Fe(II)/alpha-ketoglutarate-dependent arginine beta-hydroxylase
MEPYFVDLRNDEKRIIHGLVAEVAAQFSDLEDGAFLQQVDLCADELPRRLRQELIYFRLTEPSAICVVRGWTVSGPELGNTPAHWRDRSSAASTLVHDLFFFLCAAVIGSPVAWASKHDGFLMHNVVPIAGDEHQQLSSGSYAELTWHTEDAFHPLRADYLGLLCLRNPDATKTTLGCVEDLPRELTRDPIFFEPRFHILPDASRLHGTFRHAGRDLPERTAEIARAHMTKMLSEPDPMPVLFGESNRPYLRMDQHYSRSADGDKEAEGRLHDLTRAISDNLTGYALKPGEIIFVDNYRAVHGRKSFAPRHDGNDRWLRRLNIVRDLRKSREFRLLPESRLIAL